MSMSFLSSSASNQRNAIIHTATCKHIPRQRLEFIRGHIGLALGRRRYTFTRPSRHAWRRHVALFLSFLTAQLSLQGQLVEKKQGKSNRLVK